MIQQAKIFNQIIPVFPRLMIEEQTGQIVLFINDKEGILLDVGECFIHTEYLGVVSLWEVTMFKDYSKSITIKNFNND